MDYKAFAIENARAEFAPIPQIINIQMTRAEAMQLWGLLDRVLSKQFSTVDGLAQGVDLKEIAYFRNRLTNRIADR